MVALVALVVLAACGSPDASVRTDGGGERVVVGEGVAEMPASFRLGSVAASSGDQAFFFLDKDMNDPDAADEGTAAIFDVASSTWQVTGKAPFSEPLLNAAVTWTGTSFLVVGTRCPEVVEGSYEWYCEPRASAAAARYHPGDNRWEPVDAPNYEGETSVNVHPIGRRGDESYLALDGELWSFVDGDSGWTALPGSPIGYSTTCLVGDALVSVAEHVEGFETDGGPTADQPFVGAVFDLASAMWGEPVPLDRPLDRSGGRATDCGPGGPLLTAMYPDITPGDLSSAGPPTEVVWFSADATWASLPPPPHHLGSVYTSVADDAGLTFWASGAPGLSPASVVRLDTEAGAWSSAGGSAIERPRLALPLRRRKVLVIPDGSGPDPDAPAIVPLP